MPKVKLAASDLDVAWRSARGSVAVGWCFADEASAAGDARLDRVQADGALVRPLWHLEVANVLVQAERRRRLGPGGAEERLDMLDFLPIRVDADGQGPFWRRAVALLARAETLTAYDAAEAAPAAGQHRPPASCRRGKVRFDGPARVARDRTAPRG